MSDFVVRAAVPDDADAIGRVHVEGWREAYAHVLSPAFLARLDPAARAAGHRRRLEAGLPTWVLDVGGDIRGFSMAGTSTEHDAPRPLLLYAIYVLASEHGNGGGQALLDAAIDDEPAYLWVADDNPRAQAFYRRNGFVADGIRKIDPDWESLPELRMVR